MRINLDELAEFVKHTPKLKQLLLKMVRCDNHDALEEADYPVEPYVRSRLRLLTLDDLDQSVLRAALRCLPLPSVSLTIAMSAGEGAPEPNPWYKSFAPVLAARLGPLSLTHLTCDRRGFLITEERVVGRCSISLHVRDGLKSLDIHDHLRELLFARHLRRVNTADRIFHTPQLDTLTIFDIHTQVASDTITHNPTIRKLEISGGALSVVVDHIPKLPALCELVVFSTDLRRGDRLANLLKGLGLRDTAIKGSSPLCPLQKLVLRSCEGFEEGIAALQEVVAEIVVERENSA